MVALVLLFMVAFLTIFFLAENLQQPIRVFEISGYWSCHGEQNASYHVNICIRKWCQKWPYILFEAICWENKQCALLAIFQTNGKMIGDKISIQTLPVMQFTKLPFHYLYLLKKLAIRSSVRSLFLCCNTLAKNSWTQEVWSMPRTSKSALKSTCFPPFSNTPVLEMIAL